MRQREGVRQREETKKKQAHKETLPGCFQSRGESAQHTGLKKARDKHCPNTTLIKYN